jgi:hypothetical protein
MRANSYEIDSQTNGALGVNSGMVYLLRLIAGYHLQVNMIGHQHKNMDSPPFWNVLSFRFVRGCSCARSEPVKYE